MDPETQNGGVQEGRNADLEREVTEVYHKYAAGLLRYATNLAGNADVARDGVQETYFRYFLERRYGRVVEHPRAWLYQVLRNYVLERLGTAASRHEVSGEDVDGMAGEAMDPEVQCHRAKMTEALAAALSARERECLRLRVEGLGYGEIAAVMGIRPGTVGALLNRVQARLRAAAAEDRTTRAGAAQVVNLRVCRGGAYSS